MRALMRGALAKARELGATGEAVAMGYCFGGAAVLELARAGEALQGFATFHGGLSTPEGQDYLETRGKVMVYHGTADRAITMQDFAALAAQLEEAGVPHEMVTYSAAPHAFTVFGSPSYREVADRRSWQSFLEFLGATL
jgi:dienelactone hydrolase